MKIAFIVGKFPSLSETFILSQLTGLIDAGHDVDIISLNRPIDESMQPEVAAYRLLERTTYIDIPGGKAARVVKCIPRAAGYFLRRGDHRRALLDALNVFRHGRQALSLQLCYLLLPFLKRGPYDILMCHFGNIGLTGAKLKQMGVPGRLVVAFHGQDISRYPARMGENVYEDVFARADLLLPVSNYWRNRLIQFGANPARVRVHRMGIDVQRFPFKVRQADPGCQEVRLLTVGRLVEKKGIAYGIQAVAELARRHPELRVRYNIIGEGEARPELEEVIRACGVQDHVHLLGPATLDAVREEILESHIFLLPSHTDSTGDQEGIPVSIMEAQATGMPVLSTRHTGVPEVVEDGASGFLVDERDSGTLADRLEQLIRHPELWQAMGERGRKRIEQHYDIHNLNARLITIFRDLLDEPPYPQQPARARLKLPLKLGKLSGLAGKRAGEEVPTQPARPSEENPEKQRL